MDNLMEKKIMPVISAQTFMLASILTIVLSVAFSFILTLTAPTTIDASGNLVYVITDGFFFTNATIAQLAFLFISFLMLFKNGFKFSDILSEIGFKNRPRFIFIIISILLPIITLYAFEPLTVLFLKFLNLFKYEVGQTYLPDFTKTSNYILGLIFAALVPAFCEEILFRGVILSGFRKLGNLKGILLSALCFMLVHQNPDQTIYQFLMGIVLASLVVISNSIWTSIIVHFVNNAFTLTLSNIGLASEVLPSLNLPFILISVALCALLFVGIHFGLKHAETQEGDKNLIRLDDRRTKGYLIIGIALNMGIWIMAFINGIV